MRRLLQKARDLPDDRKVKLATSVAGSVTVFILVIWIGLFFGKIDANPAAAAGSVEDEGALNGMFNQISVLLSEIKNADFTPPEPRIETDLDQAN
jgi:hypothetical protein